MKQQDFGQLVGGPTVISGNWNRGVNVRIEATDTGYLVFSPYNPAFVQELKESIPYHARSFDGTDRAWVIEPAYGSTIQSLIEKHFHKAVELPEIKLAARQITETLRLEYLGACKERDGQSAASGFVNGGWNAVFPEAVLRAWFENHVPAGTLYAELGISQDSDAQAIKSAHRRMARQWHPDICRESNAREQFEKIQKAYELLSNDQKRKRYDVALSFTAAARFATSRQSDRYGYRAPLRCGLVTIEAAKTIKGYGVAKILDWQDIVRADGLVMSSSWDMDRQNFVIDWVAF